MDNYNGEISAGGTIFGSLIAQSGPQGPEGKTPVRGIDYFTNEDQQKMIEELTEDIQGVKDDFNLNVLEKTEQFNANTSAKLLEYNNNADSKLEQYDNNAVNKTREFDSNVIAKIDEYNQNSTNKENDFNTRANTKLIEFNNNAELAIENYDTNAENKTYLYNKNSNEKIGEFNDNVSSVFMQYNSNATEKTNAYNSNAESALNGFNNNSFEKLTEYNTNAQTKTTTFDTNATAKTETYNSNAESKTEEYNENAKVKVDEYNENAEELLNENKKLRKECAELEYVNNVILNNIFDKAVSEDGVCENAIALNASVEVDGNSYQAEEPTPEYPQEVEVVDGCNKFDGILELGTLDGSGLPILSTNQIRSKNYISVESNEIYDISGLPHVTTNFYNSSFQLIGSATELNFTVPVEAKYIKFRTWTSDNIIDINTKVMLTKGTTSKPYLPYGHIGLRQRGKNIFDSSIFKSITKNGLTITNDNRTITLNGTYTDTTDYWNYTFDIPSIKGNYILSINKVNGNFNDIGNNLRFTVWQNGYKSNKWVSPTTDGYAKTDIDVEYVMASLQIRAGYSFDNLKINLQIEELKEGQTESTSYEPYHEPKIYSIDLAGNSIAKVGDIKDLLSISEKDVVELEKKIGKIVLDGNYVTSYDEIYRKIQCADYSTKDIIISNPLSICNVALRNEDDTVFAILNNEMILRPRGNGGIYFYFWLDNINNVNEAKTYFENNKPYVYYQLATPQKLTLPTTEPIKMWEGTNIFELITNLDTTYRVEYYKKSDILTRLDVLETEV